MISTLAASFVAGGDVDVNPASSARVDAVARWMRLKKKSGEDKMRNTANVFKLFACCFDRLIFIAILLDFLRLQQICRDWLPRELNP